MNQEAVFVVVFYTAIFFDFSFHFPIPFQVLIFQSSTVECHHFKFFLEIPNISETRNLLSCLLLLLVSALHQIILSFLQFLLSGFFDSARILDYLIPNLAVSVSLRSLMDLSLQFLLLFMKVGGIS